MYVPPAFAETNREKLHDLIEKHSFGLLISSNGEEPFATHLPFLLHRDDGSNGTLIGHMAKANPHWQFAERQPVLAVFSGPHAYISPSWYEAANVVPTWNYVTVHAYGIFRAIHDAESPIGILRETVAQFEAPDSGWVFDPESDFIQKIAQQIVGFRIEIARMEGKWKLSQNHPQERREKVIRALRKRTDGDSQAIAELMELG